MCVYSSLVFQNVGGSEEAMVAWQDHTLEGTSQALEKQYLRLTSVSFTCSHVTVLKVV